MNYYLNTRLILPMTTIRRERQLPDGVAPNEVLVVERQRVDPATAVLRGLRSGSYRIIELNLRQLGVRNIADIKPEWIAVQEGATVREGQTLLQKGTGRRAPKIDAPIDCVVTRIEPHRLIVQETPEAVEVSALYTGLISAVRSRREVQVEAVGALVQCVWGNGRSTFNAFAEEPADGLESLANEDFLTTMRGQVLVLRGPLSRMLLELAVRQQVTGIIAPSMPAEMIDRARETPIPIVLTEGFGEQKISEIVYNLLRDNTGRQIALDARAPIRFSHERPEIFIPLPSGGGLPPMPERTQPLVEGVQVRIARAPYSGQSGTVRRVFDSPQLMSNGLRSVGADVELANGKVVFVPLGNMDLLGRVPAGRR